MIKIQLTKFNPKIIREVNLPCLMPIRVKRDAILGKIMDLPAFCRIKCSGHQWYGGSTCIRLRAARAGEARHPRQPRLGPCLDFDK